MTDVEKAAWLNLIKTTIIFVGGVGAIISFVYLSYAFWEWLLWIIGTPWPPLDAIGAVIVQCIVAPVVVYFVKEWHRHEVMKISEKLNQEFNDL